MSIPTQDKAKLNQLLERVILKLVGDAGEVLENRTDKKFTMGKLKGLANMKADLAKKAVEFALKRAGGNVEERLERIVELSNTHLDQFVSVVGEDRIVQKLKDMDEVVDEEAVSILEQAGAGKLAALLRKALPAVEAPATTKAFVAAGAAAVATAGTIAAVKVAGGKAEAAEPEAAEPATVAAEEEAVIIKAPETAQAAKAEDEGPVTIEMMRQQLDVLTSMRDFAEAAIAKTEDAIAMMETHEEPGVKARIKEELHRGIAREAKKRGVDRGPWKNAL